MKYRSLRKETISDIKVFKFGGERELLYAVKQK